MPIVKNNDNSLSITSPDMSVFSRSGVMDTADYCFGDDVDPLKQMHFDTAAQSSNTKLTLKSPSITQDVTITLPSSSGTLLTSGAVTVNLTNAHILVGNGSGTGADVAMTGDVTIANTGATTVGLVGGSSAANVHAAELLANAAASANTASTIVKRDGSGNFSAGTITATLSGTSTNVSGTVAIANGGTGQTSASAAFNALSPITSTGDIILGNGSNSGTRLTKGTQYQVLQANATTAAYDAVHLDQSAAVTGVLPNGNTTAASANTLSAIVARDGSGNFSAGTITATLTGTASGNTTYTANNHGVVLSGSANAMTVIAPDSSATKVLKSGGASADPSWLAYDNANTVSTLVFRDSSGNFSAGTITAALTGNASTATAATTATTATNATNVATTATNSTNASFFPAFVASSSSGNQGVDTATGLTFNPSTNTLTTTTFSGALSGNATTATTATNATNVATTAVSSNATYYPLFVASSSNGNQAPDLHTGLTYNPSTGTLTATTFSGTVSGSSSVSVTTKTAAYTAAWSDGMILCNGTFTLTLPTSSGNTGKSLFIKNIGSGTVTIVPNGSETIDGEKSQPLGGQYAGVHLIADGSSSVYAF